jgi:hypothetical protein
MVVLGVLGTETMTTPSIAAKVGFHALDLDAYRKIEEALVGLAGRGLAERVGAGWRRSA